MKKGEQRKLSFSLPVELLSFFDHEMKLVVEPGLYRIMIGKSSEEIVLEKEMSLEGEKRYITRRTRYSTILTDN